jgi:hypothetical protein
MLRIMSRATHRFSRRAALALPAAVVVSRRRAAGQNEPRLIVSADPASAEDRDFDRRSFGTVGVFDVDWLVRPDFARLLDNLAASPGAFHGVRVFGAFTAGKPEAMIPESGGNVWPRSDQPIDFAATFCALEALTSRGLIPFVVLGFFPPAVSPSPIRPPAAWDDWKRLVRTFFEALAGDPRFGPAAIADWWFEVWNEPNEGRFWLGTPEDYLALYRATSEAVAETGVAIRLGGPAIAYKPEADPDAGPPWIDRVLRFVAADPRLRCDFISLHRKGTVGDAPPDPRRLSAAAAATADHALAIDAQRFAGLTIVNDEADEKVGFEVPYAPRLDERNAAWLGAVAGIHTALNERYRAAGLRFAAAADNANLQLVQSPFDGRRSIMTRTTTAETDLLKISAYGFYELLRLLGNRQGGLLAGADLVFPQTDLYHVATIGDTAVASLLTYYPDPDRTHPAPRTIEYFVTAIPWPVVNIARFQIDAVRSNAYAAAGGSASNPFPSPNPAHFAAIRRAQEVALFRPIARNVALSDGTYRETITLAPYTTLCLWITPTQADVPSAPHWLEPAVTDGNAILRWSPNREPFFLSYDLFLLQDDAPLERLTPDPLRAALWIDTAPPPGLRTYAVRAVTACGIGSRLVPSPAVLVVA